MASSGTSRPWSPRPLPPTALRYRAPRSAALQSLPGGHVGRAQSDRTRLERGRTDCQFFTALSGQPAEAGGQCVHRGMRRCACCRGCVDFGPPCGLLQSASERIWCHGARSRAGHLRFSSSSAHYSLGVTFYHLVVQACHISSGMAFDTSQRGSCGVLQLYEPTTGRADIRLCCSTSVFVASLLSSLFFSSRDGALHLHASHPPLFA